MQHNKVIEKRNGSPTPAQLTLVEHVGICITADLPTTLSEMNRRLWKSFELGRQYERQGGDAAVKTRSGMRRGGKHA